MKLVLASGSPRRAFLLKECGFNFEVKPTHASEDFDPETELNEIPKLLAARKAETALPSLKDDELVLTADTVVIFENEILNKPVNEQEAVAMLLKLSGNTHKVITAVCLANKTGVEFIEETSWVTFRQLETTDIVNYVKNFKPLDKAGAYGAQECLPDNYNPCSGNERYFLEKLGKTNLLSSSREQHVPHQPLIAIEEIAGSYFNVMGLPIVSIYEKLKTLLD